MEHLTFTVTDRQFHLEGFPDAVKIVRLTGPKAQRLADLMLHQEDLDATLYYLDAINHVPDQDHRLREILWESAIVHLIKCFSDSESRFSLNTAQAYKRTPERFKHLNISKVCGTNTSSTTTIHIRNVWSAPYSTKGR